MHGLLCCDRSVSFNVTTQINAVDRKTQEESVCLRLQMSEERTINLGKSLCSLSALPVKPATNYCQRCKVLHLLLSFFFFFLI